LPCPPHFLALPFAAPVQACEGGLHSAKAAVTDYSAAKKKKAKKTERESGVYARGTDEVRPRRQF
jgi:hypothetical protein